MTSSNKAISDNAIQLIRDLHNNPDIIPPYNDHIMNQCAKQINELITSITETGKNWVDDSEITLFRVRQASFKRIKQCCCAYLNERMQRIKLRRWKNGGVLSSSEKTNLSKNELSWLSKYGEIVFKFQERFGENGINLLNHVDPPKSLLIHVRAVKDYGEFETSDGTTVIFLKNSMHFLPQHDCENLIRIGILEKI